ncbi:MAG: hypothetical protein FJX11_23980 [Alphaproteobacteria bacterium]|nr:hypothetical protein [Alphaproteobacteria bacterium]
MADKFELCTAAFTLLGANSIESFEDGTTESDIAASLYPLVAKRSLAAYPWRWAKTEKDLGAALDEDSLNGYEYVFQKPNDPLILRELGVFITGTDQPVPYDILRNKIFANENQDLVLRYLYYVDEEEWPDYFSGALIFELGGTFAIALEKADRGLSLIDAAAKLHWPQAHTANAQGATTRKFRSRLLGLRI